MTRVTDGPALNARWRSRRPSEKPCQKCGSLFRPERIGSRFCSRDCAFAAKVLERRPCERCGEPMRDRSRLAQRFCGRSCAFAAATTRAQGSCEVCGARVSWGATTCKVHNHVPAKLLRMRPCVECGESFAPFPSAMARSAAKYCSVDCYRVAAARRPLFLELTCPVCGTAFRRIRALVARTKNPACSRKCSGALAASPDGPSYRGGKLSSARGPGWVKIRTAIRERDGYRCRRCGKPESENGRALPVDHIIPWRTFATAAEANRPENLVALCDTCHGRKARAELKWLRGDVLEMWDYQTSVAQPWTKP